ncbi:MAG: hypothetical protein LIO96_02385, partial [Lachnospiraceae bacterium]|nr:hypothetical protein [Lachnospiraceae bacterium]
ILKNFLKMADFQAVAGKTVSYPFTGKKDKDGHEVIFDWFVHNHIVKKVKDNTAFYEVGMTTNRKNMAFAEYLKAMEPEAQSTIFKKGKNYQAKITGCNRKNIFISVEGQMGQIYFKPIHGAQEGQLDRLFDKGQTITVRYVGLLEYQGRISFSFRWMK